MAITPPGGLSSTKTSKIISKETEICSSTDRNTKQFGSSSKERNLKCTFSFILLYFFFFLIFSGIVKQSTFNECPNCKQSLLLYLHYLYQGRRRQQILLNLVSTTLVECQIQAPFCTPIMFIIFCNIVKTHTKRRLDKLSSNCLIMYDVNCVAIPTK